MSLAAGSLNTLIVIEQRLSGVDAFGQPVESWETVAQVWANFNAPTGRARAEMLSADRQVSAAIYSLRIRWKPGITAAMRVIIGAAVYDIKDVIYDMAGKQYVDLVCTTGASQG